jgi:hypothetical protein
VVNPLEGLREYYDRSMTALLCDRLPPELVTVPDVNDKRKLDEYHFTRYEEVFHASRQHWMALLAPTLRTLSALILLFRPPFGLSVAGLLVYTVYKNYRPGRDRRERLVVAVIATAAVLAAPSFGVVGAAYVLLILAWFVRDYLYWYYEVLVVTNKRVLVVHGIFTVSRPSVKIRSIGFSNCISGPISNYFQYGTIDLDTPNQRDGALSDLHYVPHAYQVWRLILQLHSEHFSELGDHSPEQELRTKGGMPEPEPDLEPEEE